jgi:alpha-beta hydrolase superfamily lysophospholipase
VGRRSEVFVDESRPTADNHGAPGSPNRRLPTTVWYPALGEATANEIAEAPPRRTEGGYPLVVFSHGFTGNGPAYAITLRGWAAAGYVVAAPTFPLTAGGTPGGPRLVDYANQPADVSHVLDEVLRLDATPGHPLADMVDEEHVAAGGHSLGGATTVGLGFNSCCQDPRVDAYVPIAGLELPFRDGEFAYGTVAAPLLLIHGDKDEVVTYSFSQRIFRRARAPKFLVTLVDGGHTPFGDVATRDVIDRSVIDFLDRFLKERDDGLVRLERDADVEGVATLEQDPG